MSSLALTADGVAAELEYVKQSGDPNGELIRQLYREGDFPPPIDPDQPVIRWRWSRAVVERYVAGEWPWPLRPALLDGLIQDRGAA
jgi:hypothetical protein